jgi:flavin-dependent dehydrogenase
VSELNCDVAIVGGGPVGSTVGTLLKKYQPNLDVAILERERFPRDHVGESLLPTLTQILAEMGVWDKVEAANFPVKLGAVYRWGREDELFHFHFLKDKNFTQTARPGRFAGQRMSTAFQVDRAVYDNILLQHAASMGCQVFQETNVKGVEKAGDRVESLYVLSSLGEDRVNARWYVDASGSQSLLRKEMGVGTQVPTQLRNIAIWDYWQNAEWAEEIGDCGTYVYVLSLGYGWIWFIPVGPSRTSIGLVTSAQYYKQCGLSTQALYDQALSEQPLIQKLLAKASSEGRLQATKDWNFIADRLTGENWFLAGDAGGFADPILAAGLTLAQTAGRRVAYSILELDRGRYEADWIKSQYDRIQRKNTANHIRFAEYWYSANGHFSDLQEYCSTIARESGLSLGPDEAFQWLGTGGFGDELDGFAQTGAFSLRAVKSFTGWFGGKSPSWAVHKSNVFELNVDDAIREHRALYQNGQIQKTAAFRRGNSVWPMVGYYKFVHDGLRKEREMLPLAERFMYEAAKSGVPQSQESALNCLEVLEALIAEGWVKASYDPSLPMLEVGSLETVNR